MGCEIEGVARTDTPDAQRLVTAVNRIGIAQQVAQHERSGQPRTAEIEGFEKRGVERGGISETLLVRKGIERLLCNAALPRDARRTARIARQGGITQEAFDAFTHQERLGDASTLDASLFKSFYFGRSRLTASLMLRNLLGDADTVYSGYESLRVRRIRSGDALYFAPHATRYTYAYPRSFYLTVSYKF